MYIVQISVEKNMVMVDFLGAAPENVPIAHRNIPLDTEFGALFVDGDPGIDGKFFGIIINVPRKNEYC
jgi:hypothetical protein